MKYTLFVFLIIIHSSHGTCPKATFEFRNKTKTAVYNFIDSSIGNIGSLETCPYTGRPYVYLPCYPNSSWGRDPYFSNCIQPIEIKQQAKSIVPKDNPYEKLSFDEVVRLPLTTSNDISNILSYVNNKQTTVKSPSDITSIVNLIDRIVTNNQYTDDIQTNLYSTANKLLSYSLTSQMRDAQKMNGSIVKLLSLMEAYSQNVIFEEPERSFNENNLAVSIVNRPNSRSEPIIGFAFDSNNNVTKPISSEDHHQNFTSIILNTQALMKQNRLAFSVYDEKTGLFNDNQHQVLTRVISLTVDKPEAVKHSGSFVKISFQLDSDFQQRNQSLRCAFWNIFDNMTAKWSTEGCQVESIKQQRVTCICNHLTHFAVLMDIEQTPTPRLVEQLLSVITLIGLLLSSIGLFLTILTFIFFKKLRRHFSQKSLLLLSINLLCVNILFSIICLFTLKQLLCVIIASLLHYFILATFSWMFIMALIQYLLFVKVFPTSISAFTRKAAAFSQLISLIPVLIVLLIDPWNYTKRADHICWLSNLPFYLSFILPIVLYIFINSILFVIVAYSLLCGKTAQRLQSTHSLESQRVSRFTVALSCFIVLGLTWTFGLFTIGPVRLLFQILFCIFASSTGFLIFILYIITSKTKRTCWNNTFKSFGISSIYSPTSSSSSGFLGSKDFSSTSVSDHQKLPTRHMQYPSQPQHFIDAYMPSSPPPPAPPIVPPSQSTLAIEGDDSIYPTDMANHLYEPRHVWAPHTNYIYETNQPTTSLDDYSLFYSSNHNATKL
ncbi:unnamed protein product [Adineta ricciae]|uniref:Uncharacterized protein n=1 Tax=Adineta ricciae TaxID=249248 RepID=A0A815UKE9_ADIRI|nr:unnamed protein product [Adineta ricciae]